jgi:hypothetical protein
MGTVTIAATYGDACVEIITRAARDLFARSKSAAPQRQV